VTLYFAFTQFYCLWLIPISLLGIFSHFLLPAYHPFYGVVLGGWTIAFKHFWERRERDLAIRWGVKGFTKLVEQRRAAYVTEGERLDPITGEMVGWFPAYENFLVFN
jgi:anoctamin-10